MGLAVASTRCLRERTVRVLRHREDAEDGRKEAM